MLFFAYRCTCPTESSELGSLVLSLLWHLSLSRDPEPWEFSSWPSEASLALPGMTVINATSLSTGSHFYQRPAQRVLPAQYLRTFSAVTQGLGEIWAELGASTRNHSQIVKTLFPCELMPFLPLFMETAQHYLATSGMTLSLPVSFPLKTRTLSEAFPSWDDLPRPRDRHRDRLRPPGQNEWVHVKIFEAEAKQGPFQKHRPLPPFAPPSYFYSSLRVWSFGNEPDVSGVSVQPRRSLGGGGTVKESNVPPFLGF